VKIVIILQTQEQLAVDIGKSYDFVRRLEYLLCHDTFSFAIANESDDRLLCGGANNDMCAKEVPLETLKHN